MNIRANLNRLFEERTLRVGRDQSPNEPDLNRSFTLRVSGDRSPNEPDLNRLFEERTLRVSGDRSP